MKKLLISLLLLFSSVFGDCRDSYIRLMYFEGMYNAVIAVELSMKDNTPMEKVITKDFYEDAYKFLLDEMKEQGYHKAYEYVSKTLKQGKEEANFFFGEGIKATALELSNDTWIGGSGESEMLAIRRYAFDKTEASKLELNHCVYY